MRQAISFCFLLMLLSTSPTTGWSQTGAEDSSDWAEFVGALESTADAERLGHLASDIGDAALEPIHWREYWTAYAAYRHGLFNDDESVAESAYKQCVESAERAIEHGERSGESEALRGACFSQLAGGGPMAGMRYGSRSGVAINTALTDAPDNPRVLMIAGTRDLYTPTQWGGDIERAVRRLERALERFTEEQSSDRTEPWQPRWGRVEAFGHLAIALDRLEREEQARRTLDRAGAAGIESPWLDGIRKSLEAKDEA